MVKPTCHPNPVHERLGEALIRGYGKAVDTLLCNTIGFCDANAMGQLALPAMRTTIGLAGMSMYNNKQKNLVTDIIDWLESKPVILAFNGAWELKAKILAEYGVDDAPKEFVTIEQELQQKVLSGEINEGNFKDLVNFSKNELPGDSHLWSKLKNGQGWKNLKDGTIWKKDQLHKDHWDVNDKKGKKVKEVDFTGKELWPNGPKNKNKK